MMRASWIHGEPVAMAEWPENKMNETDCLGWGRRTEYVAHVWDRAAKRGGRRAAEWGETTARQVSRSPSSGRSEENPAGGRWSGRGAAGRWPRKPSPAFTAFW